MHENSLYHSCRSRKEVGNNEIFCPEFLRTILVVRNNAVFYKGFIFADGMERKVSTFAAGKGYFSVRIFGFPPIKLHRLIFAMGHGSWPKQLIDHIDGDPSNNSIENLREASAAENARNRGAWKKSTSKYVGVSWEKAKKRWVACIEINGKTKTIGRYKSEIEAALAYNSIAKIKYGEFSPRLNKICAETDAVDLHE